MKKSAIILTIFLILFSTTITLAADDADDVDLGSNSTEEERIEGAYLCLEDKVEDCSDLDDQEVALTIMASPDSDVLEDCIDELMDRQSNDHWDSIVETALAIIALDYVGEDTEEAEEWLIEQNQTPDDLIWYLQQDSNEETECVISYDSEEYTIIIDEDKTINSKAGDCLSLAQSDFWLQIDEDCYDETFIIECDQNFIANLIYRNYGSSTVYVPDETESASADNEIELSLTSKCFGDSSCDYESTAWAALALAEKGYDTEAYIPYLIAMADSNEEYLPNAFIYMLTGYEDYGSNLVEEQKLGDYWVADSTEYDKYYDTSLALLALTSSSSSQVEDAKEWLLSEQNSDGCWKNKVIDTAMVLWALEGRAPDRSSSDDDDNGGSSSSVTYCTDAGYYCISSSSCPTAEDLGDSYYCPSLSTTCCITENLETCSAQGGTECSSDEVCTGNSIDSLDVDECCMGSCEESTVVSTNECEENYYTCMSECSEYQEEVTTYSCDGTEVCCRTKTDSDSEGGSSLWIWILVILILVVLVAICYVYREELKLHWFNLKSKFKKDEGKDNFSSSEFPGVPPRPGSPHRPGFPPVRRRPVPRPATSMAQQPRKPHRRRDAAMNETFRKLKEMSK